MMSKIFRTTIAIVVVDTVMIEPLMMGTITLQEELTLGRAVEPGGLDDLRRDALDGRRQDDHREAGLEPDEDQDQRVGVDRLVLDPADRIEAERRPDRVDQADLRLARAASIRT